MNVFVFFFLFLLQHFVFNCKIEMKCLSLKHREINELKIIQKTEEKHKNILQYFFMVVGVDEFYREFILLKMTMCC